MGHILLKRNSISKLSNTNKSFAVLFIVTIWPVAYLRSLPPSAILKFAAPPQMDYNNAIYIYHFLLNEN